MNKTRLLLVLGAALVASAAMLGFAATHTREANAQAGPCGTANDAVDESELELLSLVHQWRSQNLGAQPMTLSAPANRAAQWFAEAMAAGMTSAHIDIHGRDWHQRLIDCGFPGQFASGEGIGSAASAGAAVGQMTDPGGSQSGVEVGNWTCVGVGHSGNAWVVVVAFRFEPGCPEPGGGLNPPTATSTSTVSTSTPTRTPTKTATPTATPSPTPDANYGVTVTVCGGWNLLTIPVSGDVDEVFDTAALDIAAVYLQNGETWLRWAPGVPAYARNLSHVSSGDVLWVYRPEPSCADIEL